jgi:hypothetical protein
MTANPTVNPCPKCGQVKLQSHNDPGGFLAAVLTGRILTGGFKAISILAQGGAGTYGWYECQSCHTVCIGCQNCGHVWLPEQSPIYGESIRCPECNLTLV